MHVRTCASALEEIVYDQTTTPHSADAVNCFSVAAHTFYRVDKV